MYGTRQRVVGHQLTSASPPRARRSTPSAAEGATSDWGEPPARRAPYATNPTVGLRGLRTQQRILDAALQVLADTATTAPRSTRSPSGPAAPEVSIYQYFSGKDDVFRELAGQVARQMRASAEALDELTPDAAGRGALWAWVGRYTEIHSRYEPVFRAFGPATQSDDALAGGSERARRATSRRSSRSWPPRRSRRGSSIRSCRCCSPV